MVQEVFRFSKIILTVFLAIVVTSCTSYGKEDDPDLQNVENAARFLGDANINLAESYNCLRSAIEKLDSKLLYRQFERSERSADKLGSLIQAALRRESAPDKVLGMAREHQKNFTDLSAGLAPFSFFMGVTEVMCMTEIETISKRVVGLLDGEYAMKSADSDCQHFLCASDLPSDAD